LFLLAVIQVNFLDQTNHGVAHRQVLVDEFPIAVSTADNGTKKYTTLLSDLPAAIQNDSPIKGICLRAERIVLKFAVSRAGWAPLSV
jgi:hypothetical protein